VSSSLGGKLGARRPKTDHSAANNTKKTKKPDRVGQNPDNVVHQLTNSLDSTLRLSVGNPCPCLRVQPSVSRNHSAMKRQGLSRGEGGGGAYAQSGPGCIPRSGGNEKKWGDHAQDGFDGVDVWEAG